MAYCEKCGGQLNTGYACERCGHDQQPQREDTSVPQYVALRFIPQRIGSPRYIQIPSQPLEDGA